MTMETVAIVGSTLATLASGSAAVSAAVLERRARKRNAGRERSVTITVEDPVSGPLRVVIRSARRADQIRRDVEHAIRGL